MLRLLPFFQLAILMLLVLPGCSTAPERTLSREPVRYAYLPSGRDPLSPDKPVCAACCGKRLIDVESKPR